jgi:hypothetical protein
MYQRFGIGPWLGSPKVFQAEMLAGVSFGVSCFEETSIPTALFKWPAVMAEVDLVAVKELLGHHFIEMTQRYAHLAPGIPLEK